MSGTSPLQRFKVIDLTRVRSGPTCVRQLADWGAQVIKVEMPDSQGGLGFARDGSDFQNLHRNKRSITLDLKTDAGRAILFKLALRADVVVENFRPDVKHRLGIDYAALSKNNPRLVYGSISGFGQDGPYASRPGVDQIAQGMGGLMSVTGFPGHGPVRAGIAIADTTAGLYCAMGILTALLEREISGKGQWVQTSLLQAQIAILDFQATRWLIDGRVPRQAGNDHPTAIPTGVFPASDGLVNIAAVGQEMFASLARVMGAERWIDDPRYADPVSRSRNRAQLNAEIAEVTRTRTSEHWVSVLNEAGVPCGPINTIDQVFADPQVRHLGIAQPVEHPRLGRLELVGQPVRLSRTDSALKTASPEAGQHSEEILRELGYDDRAIAELRAERVI
ncbi:MAG TPA: CaiB/BaiF CoA-transferase family protein [Candidatus Binataceae bacterium]|nr:CaiB/BaiF CoA-transferase family protein [Candidatus Binataceae bacterium]